MPIHNSEQIKQKYKGLLEATRRLFKLKKRNANPRIIKLQEDIINDLYNQLKQELQLNE